MSAWLAVLLAGNLLAAGAPVTVEMDRYAAARLPQAPAVRTFGLSTCVALFIYDPSARVGGVAHLAASSDIPLTVDRLLNEMNRLGAGATGLQAQLFGGWDTSTVKDLAGFNSTSPQIVAGIKAALKANAVPVTREEILTVPFTPGPYPAIRNVTLDLATGRVTDYQP